MPKEPPEPAWMPTFRKAYALKDGEYVKRIAPPYIDERKEYMYRAWYPKNQTPEEKRRALEGLDGRKLFLALFLEYDGTQLTSRTALSMPGLVDVPQFQSGERVMTVWDAVTSVTGREAPEVVIDPKSSAHPLFSTEERSTEYPTESGGRMIATVRGTLSVAGDFVTRKGTPLAKLAPQLEQLLRAECKLDVRLAVKEEEQEVYVVGGAFALAPRKWREKDEVDLYADEGVVGKHFNRTNTHLPQKDGIRSGWQVVTPATLARHAGWFLNVRMVCDQELPTGPKFNVYRHERAPGTATPEEKVADRNPEKVLANLSAQTGLTFKKSKRRVEVLYLSAPAQK